MLTRPCGHPPPPRPRPDGRCPGIHPRSSFRGSDHPHHFFLPPNLRRLRTGGDGTRTLTARRSAFDASFRSLTGYFNFNPLYNLKKENWSSIRSNSLSTSKTYSIRCHCHCLADWGRFVTCSWGVKTLFRSRSTPSFPGPSGPPVRTHSGSGRLPGSFRGGTGDPVYRCWTSKEITGDPRRDRDGQGILTVDPKTETLTVAPNPPHECSPSGLVRNPSCPPFPPTPPEWLLELPEAFLGAVQDRGHQPLPLDEHHFQW